MIKQEEQVKIEFGKGDIRIVSSGELDGSVGYLALENQIPEKPIGKNREPEGDSFSSDRYPISMSFTKVESIDAFIGELERVRDIMSSELVYEVVYEAGVDSKRISCKRVFYSAIAMSEWLERVGSNDTHRVVSINTSRKEI